MENPVWLGSVQQLHTVLRIVSGTSVTLHAATKAMHESEAVQLELARGGNSVPITNVNQIRAHANVPTCLISRPTPLSERPACRLVNLTLGRRTSTSFRRAISVTILLSHMVHPVSRGGRHDIWDRDARAVAPSLYTLIQ